MKTYLDCIPCFFRQALEAARIVGANEATQKQILDEVSRLIPYFPLVINDATIEDAKGREIDKVAMVISSGVDAPGTILDLCSKEFLTLYEKTGMIIWTPIPPRRWTGSKKSS